MNDSVIHPRKSKYDLSRPAMLKVPSAMYYILKDIADKKKTHWSELARDYLTQQIKKVGE